MLYLRKFNRFILISLMLLGLSISSVNASLVDNGNYITDTVTGLDWSDFTRSWNKSYSQAATDNSGWRHATNSEVEGLFGVLFDGYFDTNSAGFSSEFDTEYADHSADVSAFESLFGWENVSGERRAYGFYSDENNLIRLMGTRNTSSGSYIFGLNLIYDYSPGNANSGIGSYLVRDLSPVPVPAALWLFGTALIGLVGMSRRRKVA
jgi:hypothetical protein